MSLAHASRAELTKQLTTAMWWILALVLVVYVGITAAGIGFVFSASATGALPDQNGPPVPTEGIATVLYSLAASVGYVFPLLIGTLMVTAEFRHQTLTPTFLATPRRATVLGAKVAISALLGVLYGVIAIIATVAPGAGILAGFDLDTELGAPETWALFGRIVIAFVLWALVGVGIGALVRNQVAAIVIVLAFTQFVEPLARLAASFVDGLSGVTRLLPAAASDALVGSTVFGFTGQSTDSLEWWAGGLVLLGYAAVFLVLGYVTSWRRDVS